MLHTVQNTIGIAVVVLGSSEKLLVFTSFSPNCDFQAMESPCALVPWAQECENVRRKDSGKRAVN